MQQRITAPEAGALLIVAGALLGVLTLSLLMAGGEHLVGDLLVLGASIGGALALYLVVLRVRRRVEGHSPTGDGALPKNAPTAVGGVATLQRHAATRMIAVGDAAGDAVDGFLALEQAGIPRRYIQPLVNGFRQVPPDVLRRALVALVQLGPVDWRESDYKSLVQEVAEFGDGDE